MAYIGREPQIGNFQVCDAISTVNNQAAYTMQVGGVNVSPETANHMLVSLNGILQAPTTSFTVSGSVITFASNLVTGDVINFIQILGSVLDLGVPSDATVSTAKIVDGAVTSAKLASGTGGKVLQVVSVAKTDTFSSSTTGSFTDITGMSAAITPSSTSSKILVLLNINSDAGNNSHIRLVRGSTAIGIGDASSSRSSVTGGAARNSTSANNMANNGISFLDSPSSTSATTYKVQFYLWSSGSWYLNRSDTDGDDGYAGRSASTITLMEIAG